MIAIGDAGDAIVSSAQESDYELIDNGSHDCECK